MCDELWCGQAQNGVNFDFDLIFDLEGQGQLLHKTIGTLNKLFCTFEPNLVILVWTGPELSRGQASDWHTDWHTHGRTHTQTQATRMPKLAWGKKKTDLFHGIVHHPTKFQADTWNPWIIRAVTLSLAETEMWSFCWNFLHWLHRTLSKRQRPLQSLIKISSKWHFVTKIGRAWSF